MKTAKVYPLNPRAAEGAGLEASRKGDFTPLQWDTNINHWQVLKEIVERTMIAKVLQECRGNKTKAARRLGLSRTRLQLRFRKYGLEQATGA